jgi:hypothetical protein
MKWYGLLGVVLIIAAAFLIRIPHKDGQAAEFTGLFLSERVVEYPIMVEVVPYDNNTIGVALQDYELDFGILSQGMKARRELQLDSRGAQVKVNAWAEGDIADLVTISKNGFILNGKDSLEVGVEATEVGNHSGTLFLSSRAVNYKWMGWLTAWV